MPPTQRDADGLAEMTPTPSARSESAEELVVAWFGSYDEARNLVDALADEEDAVEGLAIVARDIAFVERVTGRTDGRRAAAGGGMSGALVGALIGLFFGFFAWVSAPLWSALALAFWGAVVGAVAGALVGLAQHSLSAGRHDFDSTLTLQAGRYGVVADRATAEKARARL